MIFACSIQPEPFGPDFTAEGFVAEGKVSPEGSP
jgi:hypothetical protein